MTVLLVPILLLLLFGAAYLLLGLFSRGLVRLLGAVLVAALLTWALLAWLVLPRLA